MNLPPPTPNSSGVIATRPNAPGRTGPLRLVGNILWLLLAGIWMALGYLLAGLIQCLTIIGIPFGIQSFKLAGFALWPFGRVVVQRTDRDQALSCLGNAVWFVLSGLWLALGHVVAGLLLCLTIIGIPFGIASFKLAGLALVPFGKMIVKAGAPLPPNATVYLSVG
jgi:uncharacterized membrane protein YccF (DUF307 family)